MKTRLSNIAQIQTGIYARPTGFGELVYLQSKHFSENGRLNSLLAPDLFSSGISQKHLLSQGDILFAAKGTKNFAAVFEKHNLPAVASTSFFVIRLISHKVLPEYLAWFLNTPQTQSLLKSQAMGTSIPSISKQVMEALEIPIPSHEKQKLAVSIYQLRKAEKEIQIKLEALRENKIQLQILNAINS